jgi:sugar/nucleoside kinase (ribokinase family)
VPSVAVVGNLLTDLVLGPLARLPSFGQEVVVAERAVRSAGQAFNTAIALAALGAPPCLVSDVGDDAFGAGILDDLRKARIDTRNVRVKAGLPTGLTVALLDDRRNRAFVTHLGHLAAFNCDAIDGDWPAILQCRFLLFCGYFNLPGMRPAGALAVLERARAAGLVTALDTGWDPDDWATGGREEVQAMLRATNIFMPNLEEAQALTGRDEPIAAAIQLARHGPSTVIIKLGAAGALALVDHVCIRVPALPVEAADTVGAGDAFNAGVLHALGRGSTLADALSLGTAVAGYIIGSHEPRQPAIADALALQRQARSTVETHPIR